MSAVDIRKDEVPRGEFVDCLKNHKSTIGRLSEQFHITQEEVKSYIWMLREDFENITTIKSNKTGELLYYLKVLPNANNVYFINGPDKKERVLRFGFVSDMHFSSIFHMSESFHDVMDKLENLGVSKVYVAGDILDGAGMFKGHEETLRQFDVDGQTKIAAEAFAKHPSLEFWGISGNHDISFIKYNKKVNPLEILEMKSDNFKNLGNTSADVICHGIRIRLRHGDVTREHTTSNSEVSYSNHHSRRQYRKHTNKPPHILLQGHYHTFFQGVDNGTIVLQPGSFRDTSIEYSVSHELTTVGAFYVELRCSSGAIKEWHTAYIQPDFAVQIEDIAIENPTITIKYKH